MAKLTNTLIDKYQAGEYEWVVKWAFSAWGPLAFGGDFANEYEQENEAVYDEVKKMAVADAAHRIYEEVTSR